MLFSIGLLSNVPIVIVDIHILLVGIIPAEQ